MGTWTRSAGGVWTLAGDGVRTAAVAAEKLPHNASVKLQLADTLHGVGAIVLSSPDGRSCVQVYVDATNVTVSRIDFGVVGTTLGGPTAHLLPSGVPFLLEVRYIEDVLTVRVKGSTTDLVTWDNTATKIFEGMGYWGFEATTNGAKVLSATVAELSPIVQPAGDVLVAVAGGEVWDSKSEEEGIARAAQRVTVETGDVSIAESHQTALIVDGSNHKRYDPSTRTASDWARSGSPPAFNIIFAAGARIGGVSVPDPQNAYYGAIDDDTDFDTGSTIEGAAFALSLGLHGKIGQPIRGVQVAPNNVQVFFCSRSIHEFRGDPAVGGATITPLALDIGGSGKDAATLAGEGKVVAHTTVGVAVVVPGVGVFPVSRDVLTALIGLENAIEDYAVQVIRDTTRHGAHFFFTIREEGESIHIWYDERVGNFAKDGGGFYPQRLPDSFGPTASCVWHGKLIIGTRDGYLLTPDEADDATDDGVPIVGKAAASLIKAPVLTRDTILSPSIGRPSLTVVAGDDSGGFRVDLYGGLTAQEAYDESTRWTLAGGTIDRRVQPFWYRVRAPYIVAEISSTVTGGDAEREIWSWMTVSDGSRTSTRGLAPLHASKGWKWIREDSGYLADIQRLGAKGGVLWLPFGLELTGDFDLCAFTRLSGTTAACANAAEFAFYVDELVREGGLEHLVIYLGYVLAQPALWPADDAGRSALAAANLEPVRLLRERLPAGVKLTVVFDATGDDGPTSPTYQYAMPIVTSIGCRRGAEPWLLVANPDADDDEFTMIVAEHDIDVLSTGAGAVARADLACTILPYVIQEGSEAESEETRRRRWARALREFGRVAVRHGDTLATNALLLADAAGAQARADADEEYPERARTGTDATVGVAPRWVIEALEINGTTGTLTRARRRGAATVHERCEPPESSFSPGSEEESDEVWGPSPEHPYPAYLFIEHFEMQPPDTGATAAVPFIENYALVVAAGQVGSDGAGGHGGHPGGGIGRTGGGFAGGTTGGVGGTDAGAGYDIAGDGSTPWQVMSIDAAIQGLIAGGSDPGGGGATHGGPAAVGGANYTVSAATNY